MKLILCFRLKYGDVGSLSNFMSIKIWRKFLLRKRNIRILLFDVGLAIVPVTRLGRELRIVLDSGGHVNRKSASGIPEKER